jgi:Ca-activated chloride channel family protein
MFILILPLLFLLFIQWKLKLSKSASFKFSSVKLIGKKDLSFKVLLYKLASFLKILSILLIIVALARPQKVNKKIQRNVEGIDIVIALDVSDSMLIQDMKPENRMEASKATIRDFIKKRISDRIGLVVFAGESYTRVPMTLDYAVLLKSLSEVKTTRNIKMGTAIGVALANAVGRLRDSEAKSKVVIFLTDGENNTGTIDPLTALDIAKKFDVKIYSIGMGVDGQAQLPVSKRVINGQVHYSYRPIHSKVNVELLTKMAEETGGQFYRATTGKGLDDVFKNIDELEKAKIEVNEFVDYEELFPLFLKLALLLYLVNFLIQKIFLRKGPI